MDLSPKLLNLEQHLVGQRYHLLVPRQGPLTDLILGCDLEITSVEQVRTAQLFLPTSFDECPRESDFQLFEFEEGTPLAESLGPLLANRYTPAQWPEMFGWELHYRRFRRRIERDIPSPYPMLSLGSPTKPVDRICYVPLITDQGNGRHTFGMEPFAPDLPYVPESPSYYLLARCPD